MDEAFGTDGVVHRQRVALIIVGEKKEATWKNWGQI